MTYILPLFRVKVRKHQGNGIQKGFKIEGKSTMGRHEADFEEMFDLSETGQKNNGVLEPFPRLPKFPTIRPRSLLERKSASDTNQTK